MSEKSIRETKRFIVIQQIRPAWDSWLTTFYIKEEDLIVRDKEKIKEALEEAYREVEKVNEDGRGKVLGRILVRGKVYKKGMEIGEI